MKRCLGGCGGTYLIRDGNVCRGCENRKKSQGQSIESMFERLTVSSSPKVSSPIVRRAIENSRQRSSNKHKKAQITVKLKKKKNKENRFSNNNNNNNKNPSRKLNLKKEKKFKKERYTVNLNNGIVCNTVEKFLKEKNYMIS